MIDYDVDEDEWIDEGIKEAVKILVDNGIETIQSCEGYGNDPKGHTTYVNSKNRQHVHEYPFIDFAGDKSEGYKALDIALKHGLRVSSISRVWDVLDGEIVGPLWQMKFIGLPVRRGC